MAPLVSICATALLLAASARAHFTLKTPPTIGFDDDKEGNGPCGGFTPDFSSSVTDFHVGGEPIGTSQSHPQAAWLYRATLDQTASGNWTQLFPIVMQNSIGFFCQPSVPAPAAWVGKKGVLSVVANGDDGLLFQCSTVNFVAGTGTVSGDTCKNSSSEAAFTTDPALSALVSGSTTTPGSVSNTTPGGSGNGSTPTQTKAAGAAVGTVPRDFLPFGGMMTLLVMVGLGAAHML